MLGAKYNNKKTVVKGITFDSKLESEIYLKILELEKTYPFAYELQPEYILLDKFNVDGKPYQKVVYRGDFNIVIHGKFYTIDAKGVETPVFKLKKKLFVQKYRRPIICIKSVKEFEKWFMEKIREEGLSLYE
jgi:hypothetical protein